MRVFLVAVVVVLASLLCWLIFTVETPSLGVPSGMVFDIAQEEVYVPCLAGGVYPISFTREGPFSPELSVGCAEVGTLPVFVEVGDLVMETFVIIQDNLGVCLEENK